MSRRYSGIRWLLDLGFDLSRYSRSDKKHHVKCSQCAAAVINGVPSHEQSCPNARKVEEDRRQRRLRGDD